MGEHNPDPTTREAMDRRVWVEPWVVEIYNLIKTGEVFVLLPEKGKPE